MRGERGVELGRVAAQRSERLVQQGCERLAGEVAPGGSLSFSFVSADTPAELLALLADGAILR